MKWSRRSPTCSPSKQQMDAAKKLLDSREQLFKEGALARRLVDEASVAYAQAQQRSTRRRRSIWSRCRPSDGTRR